MKSEKVSQVTMELLAREGWEMGDDSNCLHRYNEMGEQRFEIYTIDMPNSGLHETHLSLQVLNEAWGWSTAMMLIVEESNTQGKNLGVHYELVVDTVCGEGERWMPTYLFGEDGERIVYGSRGLGLKGDLERLSELDGEMFDRNEVPKRIDFEATVEEFLGRLAALDYSKPRLVARA